MEKLGEGKKGVKNNFSRGPIQKQVEEEMIGIDELIQLPEAVKQQQQPPQQHQHSVKFQQMLAASILEFGSQHC